MIKNANHLHRLKILLSPDCYQGKKMQEDGRHIGREQQKNEDCKQSQGKFSTSSFGFGSTK